MSTNPFGRPPEYVTAEYAATQALFQHYDGFRWQSGAILIAGAFIFLGLLSAGAERSTTYLIGSALVVIIMSAWILLAHHYRQLYLFKIDRLIELEILMSAEQNLRFNVGTGTGKTYPRYGPRGHDLDQVIFGAMSVAGPGLALVSGYWTYWLLLPLATAVVVIFVVRRNERRVLAWLEAHRATASTS